MKPLPVQLLQTLVPPSIWVQIFSEGSLLHDLTWQDQLSQPNITTAVPRDTQIVATKFQCIHFKCSRISGYAPAPAFPNRQPCTRERLKLQSYPNFRVVVERTGKHRTQTWETGSVPIIQSAFSFFLKLAIWQTGLLILGLICTNENPCPQELYLE